MTETYPRAQITGLILAGGKGQRMFGQDKGLLLFQGKPLIAHSLAAVAPQVGTLLISANRSFAAYGNYGYPVICDEQEGFLGPLAGIAAALKTTRTPYLLTVPCDAPFLPENLAVKLWTILHHHQVELCMATDGERLQPLFALLHCSLLSKLTDYLAAGQRKVGSFYTQQRYALADFADQAAAFMNFNTPETFNQLNN